MYKQGVEHVKFVVCNTDKQALDNSPVPAFDVVVIAVKAIIIALPAVSSGYILLNSLHLRRRNRDTRADLPSGIVVVGGGSMLAGFCDELGDFTNMTVRRGTLPSSVKQASGSKIRMADDVDVTEQSPP